MSDGMRMTLDEIAERNGYVRDGGVWVRPGRPAVLTHVHSAACSIDSCGPTAVFFCVAAPARCLRRLRKDADDKRPCGGHHVPSRDALIAYSLQRNRASAATGTAVNDEQPNTWSDERADVARGMEPSR